ncbi:MAG: topoisomerase IV [Oscillospiraceae bacterium]|jgi:DNA gyrase subunit A|nr:topoisomerase IV [Oscillospiraceae bacterium]
MREQLITETLETNYMPYAISVIVSRAIPEIDGFKPSHRKLLYTMYKMGLLNGGRTKSANIVGQTMRLNPHGDGPIYETMVRLSQGNGALLNPFVDSKGNFGKVFSRDMAYAASRYTEAKLTALCKEIFGDIDKDAVDFTDNYDGTTKEPLLLPTAFPNILTSANLGIAVGMASNICGFNLTEVCEATIAFLKNPNCDLLDTLKAPDFTTGGELLYDREQLQTIYNTGRGSFKVRAKWKYIKAQNIIEVYEIPYTTTIEAIQDKIAELVKNGKIRDISDCRDEIGLSGFKLAIDLKRGSDPDAVMRKLFRMTPLQDSFGANFNILVSGMPKVMGIREILSEWTAWRVECVRRRVYTELTAKKDRLHLLRGLGKILLDIDKAIRVIRETDSDAEVVPNLMIEFGIDEIQANYVAEIKLRNINREYILKQTKDTGELAEQIADLEDIVNDKNRVKAIITKELKDIAKKYGTPRHTEIIAAVDIEDDTDTADEAEDYPVTLFLSKEGYFKKITPLSLRLSGEHKYKDDDSLSQEIELSNRAELLFFTDKCQVYKTRASDFTDSKASLLGDYIPSKLGFDPEERVIYMAATIDYSGDVYFFFANGKAARVPLNSYETKTNRKKLANAYSDKSPLVSMCHLTSEAEFVLFSSDNRAMIFGSAMLTPKSTRDTQGVQTFTAKAKRTVAAAKLLETAGINEPGRYRAKSLPSAGANSNEQLTL